MKNSTHVIIWGAMGVPIGVGLAFVLPVLTKDQTVYDIVMLGFICGYGFLIQGLREYFEKREKQSRQGVKS